MNDARHSRSWLKRLAFMALAFVLFLVVAEIGLRVFGAVALRVARGEAPDDRDRVILTLGDSFTYGIGAGPAHSYPAQLQALINRDHPDGVRVVNGGQPYMDSTTLLAQLPKTLNDRAPDAVVLLVGYNNRFREHVGPHEEGWRAFFTRHFGRVRLVQLAKIALVNLEEDPNAMMEPHVPKLEASEVAEMLKSDPRLADTWEHFKVFAQGRDVVSEPKEGDGPGAWAAYGLFWLCVNKESDRADAAFDKAFALDHDHFGATAGAGYLYVYRNELVQGFRKVWFSLESDLQQAGMGYLRLQMGDPKGAVEYLRQSYKLAPFTITAPHGLAIAYMRLGQLDDAMFAIRIAQSLEPWNVEVSWTLGEIYLAAGQGEKAVEAFEKSLGDSHHHPGHYGRITRMWQSRPTRPDAEFADDPVLAAWGPHARDWRRLADWTNEVLRGRKEARAAENLIADLGDIHVVLQNRGIPLYLMSYPDNFYREELRAFAKADGIPFIDHVPDYEKILLTRERDEIFRRDGHCTPEGYGIMARNVYEALKADGLTEPRVAP
ncbi:MAG: hypothetical protein H6683_08745 [Deltaproteobacteria bacterium]|nr:hypothetical protein [Deltaproteobacteria bacterium]